MYNWSNYISDKNIEAFKAEYGLTKFQYDTFANNEELLAKLKGGASGYDIAAPTAEYVPGMVQEGFLAKLDLTKIPNTANISSTFKNLWWDPTNEYQVPKDYGTTGILYRSGMLPSVPTSWKDFYDLVKGAGSGKTVFVDSMGDVFVFPLKMLGYSLNSIDQNELDEARKILLDVAPHILALDSDTYGQKMADGEAALTLGWTGPLGQELKDTKDKGYTVPSEGTLFWMDTWVMLADAPHPNGVVRLARLHPPPGGPGRRDRTTTSTRRPMTAPGSSSARARQRPGDLPAGGHACEARAGTGHIGQQPAPRHLAGVQVEDRQLVAVGEPRSTDGDDDASDPMRSRPAAGSDRACSRRSCCCRWRCGTWSCSSCR